MVYQFYPLPFLLRRDGGCGRDPEALLKHGHARLGVAPLDFGQARFLLSLFVLQFLNKALVVALHLFHFLLDKNRHLGSLLGNSTDILSYLLVLDLKDLLKEFFLN